MRKKQRRRKIEINERKRKVLRIHGHYYNTFF
jgi:hypothetical protein